MRSGKAYGYVFAAYRHRTVASKPSGLSMRGRPFRLSLYASISSLNGLMASRFLAFLRPRTHEWEVPLDYSVGGRDGDLGAPFGPFSGSGSVFLVALVVGKVAAGSAMVLKGALIGLAHP